MTTAQFSLFTRLVPRLPSAPGAAGVCLLAGLLAGCEGPQSILDPAGFEAERVAELFWWMAGGAAVIWLVVIGLALYATRFRPAAHSINWARWLILGAGAIFPTVVLAALLSYGLFLMPQLRATEDVAMEVEVVGEQWWWRVRYRPPQGEPFELANEIRLPVGQRVAFLLSSPDVIHSFWIPALGGKMDMIPGRVNRLVLEPTRTGVFRGACAEYCGDSHALMKFAAVVMEPAAFDTWLVEQARPAAEPATEATRNGRTAFLRNGCGACHQVRGTQATGEMGPDLTHLASRLTLAAGILPNDPQSLVHWLRNTTEIKPGVHMPAFAMLPEPELTAIAAYLSSLQ